MKRARTHAHACARERALHTDKIRMVSMLYSKYEITRFPLVRWGCHYFSHTSTCARDELKIEDSVLLEGIGIFQAILFVYLELAKSDAFITNILKWSIPFIMILFFVLIGYGSIKNTSRHRFWSSIILFYYLLFQLLLILTNLFSENLSLVVGSNNIVALYFSYSYMFLLASISTKIWDGMKRRYGCVETKNDAECNNA